MTQSTIYEEYFKLHIKVHTSQYPAMGKWFNIHNTMTSMLPCKILTGYIRTWENVFDLILSRLQLEENGSITQKLEGNMQ